MSAVSLVDGLALAATLKADRDAVAVRHGLTDDLADALGNRIREVRALGPRERERALGKVIAALRAPVPESATLPPRAAALLATEVPRRVGAAWMAGASLPRRGFRASPALRASLRRLASSHHEPTPERTARDHAAGLDVLSDALRGPHALDRDAVLGSLDPADRDALVAIEARTGASMPSDEPLRARRVAFVRVALGACSGAALVGAIGAMERGARGEGEDRWARAGRESAMLWERGCRG